MGLNSVVNGRILRETPIKEIFILPAAGDTGQCLGNVYYGYYEVLKILNRLNFHHHFLILNNTEREILA